MYNTEISPFGELMKVSTFIEYCETGMFIDSDGFALPIKDYLMDEDIRIYPSNLSKIPSDCECIIWFNK